MVKSPREQELDKSAQLASRADRRRGILGGTLNVQLNGFTPTPGQWFNLVPGLPGFSLLAQATTRIYVGSSANTWPYGQPLTIGAQVSSNDGGTPTGTVSFYDGTTLLATHSGDANDLGSSNSFTETIV